MIVLEILFLPFWDSKGGRKSSRFRRSWIVASLTPTARLDDFIILVCQATIDSSSYAPMSEFQVR
jgi:hypothetical protein